MTPTPGAPARSPFKITPLGVVLIVVACMLTFGSLVSLFLILVPEPSERAAAFKAFKESPGMLAFFTLCFVAILISTVRGAMRSLRERGARETLEDEALNVCVCFAAGAVSTMPVEGPGSAGTGGGSFGGGGASSAW